MPHKHWPKDDPFYDRAPWCDLATKKECDERFADHEAERQVQLAERIVAQGRAKAYRKDTSVFGQLVSVIAGDRATITTADGNESAAPFTRRLVVALDRRRLN